MIKLTVAEYHNRKKVSKKTIYKWIDQGKLKTEKELVNNKPITFIILEEQDLTPDLPSSPEVNKPSSPDEKEKDNGNKENFSDISEGQDLTPDLPSSPEVNKPPSPVDEIIDLLKQQLIEKDRQLAEKDKQLNNLVEQINQFQKLLDQEQQLHARTTLLLTEYQKKGEMKEEEKQSQQAQTQEPKKKRSWLYKLFFEV